MCAEQVRVAEARRIESGLREDVGGLRFAIVVRQLSALFGHRTSTSLFAQPS